MELDKAIATRRSIRKFKKQVPGMKLIKKCIEAACHAPSAHNRQPWKFAIVEDPEQIEKLSKTQQWSAFLAGAPIVIVVLADESISAGAHWIEDCSNATMLLLLKANELGLGACWNAVYSPENKKREEYVKKILGVKDKGLRVLCNIGIGFPDEKPSKKKIKSFDEAVWK